jgi:hypothetical protein
MRGGLGLPLQYYGRANREAAAFGAVEGEAALGEGIGGDGEAEAKGIIGCGGGDLAEEIVFGKGVDEVTVGADAPAPIA